MSNLVKKAQSKDKDAFVMLIEQYKTPLYRAARAILHSDEDAADAIQDTVLTAWQSIQSLKNAAYFKTWLTRILINHCYAILKHSRHETPMEFLPEEIAVINSDDAIDVDVTMQNLAYGDKLILTLFYLNDLSCKDIAQVLSLSENTVRTRLSRSRAKFKDAYLKKEALV